MNKTNKEGKRAICKMCGTEMRKWFNQQVLECYHCSNCGYCTKEFLEPNTMTKQQELLKSFTEYCEANPEYRFWQALRNFSGYAKIGWYDDEAKQFNDTFYYENLHQVQEEKIHKKF
jgi:hypothetical protein